jgi:hypothetical protein
VKGRRRQVFGEEFSQSAELLAHLPTQEIEEKRATQQLEHFGTISIKRIVSLSPLFLSE